MTPVTAFVCAYMSNPWSKWIIATDVYNAASDEHPVPRLAFVMRLIRFILLLVTVSLPIPVYATSPGKSESISLDRAASIAKSRTGGRVLSAEKREVDGRLMYRIKILTPKGRVRSIYIDPRQQQ